MDKKTYIEIRLGAIRRNVEKIIGLYSEYKYRIAVVKSDCYGHKGRLVVQSILDAGANYIAVSFLEEAKKIREDFHDIPVMMLIPPPEELVEECIEHDVEITVNDIEYLKRIKDHPVKIHIRADGGYDMFNGPRTKEEFTEWISIINSGKCILQGIYLHNYFVEDEEVSKTEFANFEAMTEGFDLNSVPVVSAHNSMALVEFEKKPYANGFRMGNVMYGIENSSLKLEDTFYLYSTVTNIKLLQPGEAMGYSKCCEAVDEPRLVGVIPIGYGDGFEKSNIGRDVFINGSRYRIAGVTMDVTLLWIDENVHKGDRVTLIAGNRHIDEIAEHIHTIAEEELCALNTRIERQYLND